MMNHNGSQQNIGEIARSSGAANFLWLAILAFTSVASSLLISCVTPFAALAVALAGTVRLATALKMMMLIWFINQVIGFGFYNFPRTLNVVLWGVAIGGAAIFSATIAASVIQRGKSLPAIWRLGLALLLALAGYQIFLFLTALLLGGLENFSAAVVGQVGLSNLIWFAVMIGLNELGAMLCEPRIGKVPRLIRAGGV